MPSYLLTFDLKSTTPDARSVVSAALDDAKWCTRLQVNAQSWAYPNTTRSGAFANDAAAISAFRSAIQAAKTEATRKGKGAVVIEKVYITQRTEVLFETDDKKPYP